MARSPVLMLLLATTLVAGCSDDLNPITVALGCPTKPLREPRAFDDEPADRLVSDFENGSKELALVSGRNGRWELGYDLTGGSWTAEASNRCVANGEYSGHFAGKGFTDWGLNWTAIFRKTVWDPVLLSYVAAPYDGTAYQGISFFAAFGGENGPEASVPMGITTMDNAWNGKICRPGQCMDYYRIDVPLTHTWQRFHLRFADMAQTGTGFPLVPTMRKDQMVGFIIFPDRQFDIWIDDVRLEP